MKAADRCQENFQGDRCQKAKHHDYETAQKQDFLHVGNFTAWTGSGDSQRVKAKAKGATIPVKRNRTINRILRRGINDALPITQKRLVVDQIIKYFRGEQ